MNGTGGTGEPLKDAELDHVQETEGHESRGENEEGSPSAWESNTPTEAEGQSEATRQRVVVAGRLNSPGVRTVAWKLAMYLLEPQDEGDLDLNLEQTLPRD